MQHLEQQYLDTVHSAAILREIHTTISAVRPATLCVAVLVYRATSPIPCRI